MIYAAIRPATYTASSQLLAFNKQLQLGPDSVIASAPADSSLVQSQIEIIQSPNVLRKTVHLLKLTDDAELSAEAPDLSERVQAGLTSFVDLPPAIVEMLGGLRSRPAASIWATADELKTERALSSLKGKLSVKRVGSSQIILVAFKHSDPKKAANIVNQIAQASLRDVDSMTEGALSGSLGLREHIKNSRSECTHNIHGCASDPPRWANRPLDRHRRYGAWLRRGRWNSHVKSFYGSHDPHTRAGHFSRWS